MSEPASVALAPWWRQAKEPQGIFRPLFAIELWQSSVARNAKMHLLLRIKSPGDRPMVVEANLDHDFLERARKLVLICEKIRRTMNGPAKVTIDNSREYVLLESETVLRWVMAKAGVNDWQALQYVVIPDDLMLGELGRCLVLAGMRRSQTFIDREGLWFQGTDGTMEYVSVKVDRQGLDRLLALAK